MAHLKQQEIIIPKVSNFTAEILTKDDEREQIRLQCEQYFAAGGKITTVPIGASGELSKEDQKDIAEKIRGKLGIGSTQDAARRGSKRVGSSEDISGMQFNDLLVIRLAAGRYKGNERLWDCVCKCGAKEKVRTAYLMNGSKKRCTSCQAKMKSKAKRRAFKGAE